ncbi:MAG TPA: ACT domain-containing protein [Candidatus Methylomirabilis sp.]|nr:ACT domain-containing protein [Candidatus Methylomirabilis sp.]
MRKVTQLTLTMQSKPGVLATVCATLANAGINVDGVCAPETAGKGKVRLLVGEAPRAQAVLKQAKLRAGIEEALALTLENRPGSLAEVAGKLARAKVNIKCAYATTPGPGGQATLVLTVSNLAKAMAALGG